MPFSYEALTRQFYQWEIRGRGYQQWPRLVRLEPAFRPFLGHFVTTRAESRDDGRRESLFAKAASFLSGRDNNPEVSPETSPDEDAFPEFVDVVPPVAFLTVGLPEATRIDRDAAEAFLLSLCACRESASFEVIGTAHAITIQWSTPASQASFLREQLKAFFPSAAVVETKDVLRDAWSEPGYIAIRECALAREFMLPLRTFARSDPDPLLGLVASMETLASGECAIVQILFEPARESWPESVRRAVTDGEGNPFFADAPALTDLAFEKIERPLFAAVIRAASSSPDRDRATQVLRHLLGSLAHLGRADGNELTLADNEIAVDLESDLLRRTSHRSGMLLSSGELCALVHPPSASITSAKLVRRMRRTRPAPERSLVSGISLGTNDHAGVQRDVHLSSEERMRHLHVIGASGTGKSNLLLDLALQIIRAGEGIALIDPHGDLIDEVLARIPSQRDDDVVLFDAGDAENPIGFNLLAAHSEIERTLLASDLVAIFRRLSTTWGDQMNAVLANAIQAFLTSTYGGTLADLRRFLIEPDFRKDFLATVEDEEIVYYWTKEFPLLVGKPAGPILTRLDGFLRPKPLRAILAQRESRLDFREILDRGRILLVKLAQGAIGEENSALLGSLVVAKLHQAAISRQDIARETRREFTLVVDEFQEVVTPSVERILAGTRKYRLGLVAAHQAMRPVFEADAAVASALLANAATRVVFRVGEDDAKRLAEGFAHFESQDLSSLGIGEAVCRVDRADHDFNLKTRLVIPVDRDAAQQRRDELVARSRSRVPQGKAPAGGTMARTENGPGGGNPGRSKSKGVATASDSDRLKELLRSTKPPSSGERGTK